MKRNTQSEIIKSNKIKNGKKKKKKKKLAAAYSVWKSGDTAQTGSKVRGAGERQFRRGVMVAG